MNWNTITRLAGKVGHKVAANGPTILTVAGITGGVVSGYLAARAAYRHGSTLAYEFENANTGFKQMTQDKQISTPAEKVGALAGVYSYPIKKTVIIFGPAIGGAAISIAAILWGHGILRARNAALVTAYTTLERTFAAYRKRVREEIDGGEEYDRAFTTGEAFEAEKGQKSIEENPQVRHLYTRIFDEKNPEWSEDIDYTYYWLKIQQQLANDRLCSKGHVFLNEILDSLGYDHTPEGALVGWQFDGEGDGFIDFGLDKIHSDNRAFQLSLDKAILLEFNVDGVIYDRI